MYWWCCRNLKKKPLVAKNCNYFETKNSPINRRKLTQMPADSSKEHRTKLICLCPSHDSEPTL